MGLSDDLLSSGFSEVDGSMCLSHVEDQTLRLTLKGYEVFDDCRFCGDKESSVAMATVITEVMDAIQFLYESPENAGVPWDGDDGWMGASVIESDSVVYDVCSDVFAAAVEDDVLGAIIEALGPTEWTANRHADSLDAAQWAWDQFVQDVKSESRFVFWPDTSFEGVSSPGQRSASFLWSLLPYVEKTELSLLTTVPVGTPFYRGRLLNDPADKNLGAKKLGPAPADKAAANRMSPEGVPMFYGSATPQTAVREIAAHGIGPYACIGGFKNQRELILLDLTTLPKLPSIFDKSAREGHGVVRFFREFARHVTAPVRPDGRPHVEYVPTQVVTEFFRWVPTKKIDGIKLLSAQDGEDTYVLFFDQDQVEDEKPKGPANDPPKSAFFDSYEPPDPVLTLGASDVRTYRVIRNVEIELYK
ncbi:HEPN-associated N-terminal domain-containing protein [Pseudarthrobacter sp. MDT3-28]|uniref:HEPN-associated N-terminal domain-containing protein n=1 Tax=Pseudarthrobacter raffinosi TaxID=2953651 RepID=UPI00208FC14F|nr:HEPN-associated N-terminal domain-containing protein [Pseudarthrobacter sp. MDT3-28]MCO4239654.1 HEPN-associated N-terminal domain-containing protein [Pseudarthrobacter sp. MDT3-28]